MREKEDFWFAGGDTHTARKMHIQNFRSRKPVNTPLARTYAHTSTRIITNQHVANAVVYIKAACC